MDCSSNAELRELAAALAPIARTTDELGIPWILIGAAARDLLLQHMRGWQPSRRTMDVDVAIQVGTWEEHASLQALLVSREDGQPHRDVKQRISLPTGTLDIVPCGGIEKDGAVAWPPDDNPLLDVRGLREAFAGALQAILPGPLEIFVVSLDHYLGLKLLAWRDRHLRMPMHDAVDLGDLFRRAGDLIEFDLLYRDHPAEMEAADFDPARATLMVMGQRLRASLTRPTTDALLETLCAELDEDGRLELLRELRDVPDAEGSLRALLQGLEGL